jgi:SAM-dependent methyltransferase
MLLRPRPENILAFGSELSSCRYRLTLARYESLADFLRREVATSRQDLRVLDVACGQGRLILYARPSRLTFYGADISRPCLATARERGYAGVVEGNAAKPLPFPDEAFDVIVCSHILEHLSQPQNLVSEAYRMLRPGGLFAVGVPITVWWTRWLRIHLVPLLVPSKRPEVLAARFGHVQFFTLPILKNLLRQFQIEDVRGFRMFSAGRHLPLENWRWYYRFNAAWGKAFPRLTSEVNVIARKPTAAQPVACAPGAGG